MKTTLKILLLGGALLLATATETRALPPRQHAASGSISAIDLKAHTITLASSQGGKPLVLVWSETTRFSQGWHRICLGALERGQSVKVYYRQEPGRLMLRATELRGREPARCHGGASCAEQK